MREIRRGYVARVRVTSDERSVIKTNQKHKQEYVRNIDSQISRMLRSAPKRTRHSGDVLKQMISDLETKRSTTSMSLSKEKDLIRDIRELKG